MRQLVLVCAMVLLVGAAFGQVTVLSGYATNQGWGGYYPAPAFVPLVTTPMVTLNTASPSAVGASNATSGMIAGATNSTLSTVQPPVAPVYTVPVWSGYDLAAPALMPTAAPAPAPSEAISVARVAPGTRHIDLGVATSEVNVAEAARIPRQHEHAVRTYTNEDINRINQQNGTVKYRGKTEHIG